MARSKDCDLSKNVQCLKSVCIWRFYGPYFPTFGLNTERYSVPLRLQCEWVEIQTRNTPNTDTFHTVVLQVWKSNDTVSFFNLALFMVCDKHTMRLIQSGVSCQNPFWRFVSIYLFFEAKLKSLFRMTEVNVFDRTGKYNKCLRGGWIKFSGFPASPFLYANTVTPDFHTSGNVLVVQAVWRIFFIQERRTGHFLTYSFPTHPFSDVFRG